ncbi:uncharacterized protein LOC119401464 [Rhipicephalus sanguineus]|uniref:uncharacterized protein LOC119401464 n=1 Tax=Rhipicephalus sanguineus TaxID=34632 RepID=UPI001893519D|nr:uncharacterized protein LOC119401464 [Rhipicephalus sanguineus]
MSSSQRSSRSGDSFGSLGRPSPESQSSAVISLLSHARTLRVPYGEQKRMLAQALLGDPHFAESGELLQTMEKGVMYPVIHLYELPGPFVPMEDRLLGHDRLGPDYVLHQGIYEEIRQHLPYGRSAYASPDDRRTAYIVAGFKVLEATFRDVMENSWKDWTGARAIYINLAHEFGLHRFSLYRRSQPTTDFSTFSYVLLIECRTVTADNALRLLDFVQRFRSSRMSGYLSVYNARHLGLESYARGGPEMLVISPTLHGPSDWWKQVQDAVATSSNGSTSDLSSTTSESASSDDNPRPRATTITTTARCPTAPSSATSHRSTTRVTQPLTAVEVVSTQDAPLCYVDNVNVITLPAGVNHHHSRSNKCSTMTPIYENLVGSSRYYQDHDTHSSHSSRSHRSGRGSTNGSSTNGLGETDLSYSVEEESYSSTNTGSGSDDVDSSDQRRPRSSRSSTMRRVWFEDCALLDNVIAQAAEREPPAPPEVEQWDDGDRRSLAKEYLALDEMLRNLQCADEVPPPEPKSSVRRKLW